MWGLMQAGRMLFEWLQDDEKHVREKDTQLEGNSSKDRSG